MLTLNLKRSCFISIFLMFFVVSSVSADCTVQGLKKYYTDDKEADGSLAPTNIMNANITSSTGGSSSKPLYSFTVPVGNSTIYAPVITGYDVGYTLCYNVTSCHTSTPTKAQSVSINCSSGFADLWWHYTKTGDLDKNKVLNMLDIFQLIKLIFS